MKTWLFALVSALVSSSAFAGVIHESMKCKVDGVVYAVAAANDEDPGFQRAITVSSVHWQLSKGFVRFDCTDSPEDEVLTCLSSERGVDDIEIDYSQIFEDSHLLSSEYYLNAVVGNLKSAYSRNVADARCYLNR